MLFRSLKTIGTVDPGTFDLYDNTCALNSSITFSPLITTLKSFQGTYAIPAAAGLNYLWAFRLTEYAVDLNVSIFDLYDLPSIRGILTLYLGAMNNPGSTINVTDLGTGYAQVTINDVYTTGTNITLYMTTPSGGTIVLNQI